MTDRKLTEGWWNTFWAAFGLGMFITCVVIIALRH